MQQPNQRYDTGQYPQRPSTSQRDPTPSWRSVLRLLASIGAAVVVGIIILMTVNDRQSGGIGADAANMGLYVERIFFVGCVAVVLVAVYVGSAIED